MRREWNSNSNHGPLIAAIACQDHGPSGSLAWGNWRLASELAEDSSRSVTWGSLEIAEGGFGPGPLQLGAAGGPLAWEGWADRWVWLGPRLVAGQLEQLQAVVVGHKRRGGGEGRGGSVAKITTVHNAHCAIY